MADLGGLVHRVERDDRRPGLPGAEQREDELRGVLQHDRDPVAALQPPGGEVPGHGVGELVRLAVGEAAVEVGEGRMARGPGDGVTEGVHQGLGGVDGGPLGLAEQREPGLRRVDRLAHAPVSSHLRWRWFILPSQWSVSLVRAR